MYLGPIIETPDVWRDKATTLRLLAELGEPDGAGCWHEFDGDWHYDYTVNDAGLCQIQVYDEVGIYLGSL